MSPDAVRELWVRFVTGEALPAAEQAALVAALEADAALRAELLEDVQLDGALRAMGDARRSGDAFAASVAACLDPERDATRFVRKVAARLADLPPEPAGAGRDSRSNLPRVSRRFHRGGSESAGWKSALAAACALFALLLLSTAFSSKPARPKPAPAVVQETPAPAPEPKAPETVREERRVVVPPVKRPVEPAPGPEFRDPKPLEVPPSKGVDATASKSEPPPVAAPAPAPTRSAEEAAIARGPKVESVFDQVYFAKGQTRVPVGAVLEYGQDLYTRGRGRATLRYDDGTTVVVGPETMVRDLSGAAGRRLVVSVGDISSDIKPQIGGPMIFQTPHAEATIVGTRIRLAAGKDASTLDVDEGKVRFLRLADRAATDVGAGQTSTASASSTSLRDLKPRIAFPNEFVIRFAPPDAPKEKDVYLDAGLPFSASRGYGWDGARDGQIVPNAKQPDGRPVVMGRQAVWKMDPQDPRMKRDDHRTSSVVAGWGAHAETWKIELPNGRYGVTVCVGDYTFEQGPHHVAVEGRQIVNRVMTKLPKAAHVVFTEDVEVSDGELNMTVGGYTALQKSVDTSRDTLINYLVIKRVPAK
ncbi:MAG TPA: FecR family protein [Planctomycetota bacterium]